MEIGGIERQARPMPLVVLADTSGSMSGAKISSLNQALNALVQDLKSDEQTAESVLLSIITFDDLVEEAVTLESIKNASLPTLKANGTTAMGRAFTVALTHLSNEQKVPRRSLVPVIVLASDGQPTDEWRRPLDELRRHQRVGSALRLALGIGDDADMAVLQTFASAEYPVLRADEPEKIKTFFKWVTWVSKGVYKSGGRDKSSQPPPGDLLP